MELPGLGLPLQLLSDDPEPTPAPNANATSGANNQIISSIDDSNDPLATLASAAISTATNGRLSTSAAVTNAETKNAINSEVAIKTPKSAAAGKGKNQWQDVGILKQNQCTVQHFFVATPEAGGDQVRNPDADFDTSTLPSFTLSVKSDLEPGTAYKLRVCAVNACGRGPWSEISAFKTCLPGYPGAPSAIKITKSGEGAHLSWEAPQFTSGEITEYSVYLAVKSATTQQQTTVTSNPNQLAFVRVYCGKVSFYLVFAEAILGY